jgi:hypothetical protein
MQRLLLPALVLSVALGCASAAPQAAAARAERVTSPQSHLGRPVGADFQLADWKEVSSYFETLDRESARVIVERVGETTEGRPFLLAVASSEANLARLDEIRAHARLVADPRGASPEQKERALAQGRPILMISSAMHSTETAAPQFAMELAYLLATSDEEPYRSARERLVVLILPCTNPDGLDHVVQWYRETLGTPHESTGLTRLYQLYAGHDNNRDWFMLALQETRLVTELLYSKWFPTVYWDVHQQGSGEERMFVPPFRDPLNPNLDPAILAGINLLGTRALYDLTAEGKSGVGTGVSYDMWWNGGNRNVPVRHNIVGLLTEAASVNVASPIFLEPDRLRGPSGLGAYAPSNQFPMPWPGGWWRLRDIIDYELGFARSLLRSLSAEPRIFLASALAAAERAVEKGRTGAPRGWVIPSTRQDIGAVRRLADSLLLAGVELHLAEAEFEADGRRWPAGSIVIRREQPYGQHVKDLFEVQRYPGDKPPYDVAGWTLPLLMGVARAEIVADFAPRLRRAASPDEAVAAFALEREEPGSLQPSQSDDWRVLFAALRRGEGHSWSDVSGTFEPLPLERANLKALPRVGLYSPWSGSMDEGWMRWVFDHWQLPYTSVRNETLRAGRLDEILDVLVLPDVSAGQLDRGRAPGSVPEIYAGGLDPEGAVAVEAFVRRGGTLVAIEGSAAWAVDLFELPLVDVTRGEAAKVFSCPGSVLRGVPVEHALTAGLPENLALFFSGSRAWKETPRKKEKDEGGEPKDERKLEVLLRYAPTRLLLSGWIQSPETIENQAAWLRAEHGKGTVHLFGFSPQFRGWSQGTFQLVFRAALLEHRR